MGLDSVGEMPQYYHFSRLLKRLACDEGLALLDEMFQRLVSDPGEQSVRWRVIWGCRGFWEGRWLAVKRSSGV